MKLSELIEVIKLADETTPSEQFVIYGCDCGCGGDFYEDDEYGSKYWEEAHDDIEEARKKLLDWCNVHNIIDDRFTHET